MPDIDDLLLDGGRVCLNFINTIHDRFETPQRDYLNGIDDLIDWAGKVGILSPEQLLPLHKKAQTNSAEAVLFFEQAVDLRELLYTICIAVTRHREVPAQSLLKFNRRVYDAFSKLGIGQDQLLFVRIWQTDPNDLDNITLPIIKDAYHLLLLNVPEKIKECPKCGWLFFDGSKNGKRKWCNMKTCGSRAKALQWYHRHKGQ